MHEQDFGPSPLPGASRRLDSWKDIAEYLGRDVSTAMRWAKSQGLPVRRIAGGKGRSVFAFTQELDSWLAGHETNPPAPVEHAGPAHAEPLLELIQQPAKSPPPNRRSRVALLATAAALVIAVTGASLFSLGSARTLDPRALRVEATTKGVTVVDLTGAARVIHSFDPADMTRLVERTPAAVMTGERGTRAAIVGVSYYQDKATKVTRSGELIRVDTDGNVVWRAGADYSLRFRDETFNAPYVISDWQLAPSTDDARRMAMASHHWMWWASPVTLVDHGGRRGPSFVNPGWMESLRWLDDRHIVAGGFNNQRDAAAVTLLDTQRMHGQAPGTTGTEFECLTCGPDAPVFYATLPRSELNRVTGSRFNRARIDVAGDQVIVTTIEIAATEEPATAIYDFSRDMQLLKARYSEAYWDWHRRLEGEGRVTHTRANCPDRDGPSAIQVWSGAGWQRTVARR